MSKFIYSGVITFGLFSAYAFGASPAPAGSGLVITGYIDVQHQWGHGILELNQNVEMAGHPTGFTVNEGAMVLSDEFQGVEMTVDIPFRSTNEIDTTTGEYAGEESNELELATEQAQAYLKYQYDSGFYWQLGQFDSYFGTESNDTVDLLFTDTGILRDFLPRTHTGALVGYSFLPFYVQLLIANPNASTRQPDDQSAEFAVRLGWSQEPIQAAIGFSYTKTDGQYVVTSPATEMIDYQPRLLLNTMVQARFGKLDFAGEMNIAQSRLETAGTVTGREDHEMVMGYLVQGIFNFNRQFGAGVRYEYIRNDETNKFVQAVQNAPGTPGITTITGQNGYVSKLTLGTRYFVNDELAAKIGVDLYNLNVGTDLPVEGKSITFMQAAAGMVYDF